jgi:hypothetical protein
MQHRKGDPIEYETLIATSRMPGNSLRSQGVEELIVQRIRYAFSGLEHKRCRESLEDAGHTAKMIGVGMGDDQRRKLPDSAADQKRHQHPAAGVTVAAARSCIDNNPPAGGRSQDCTIALTYVEKM